MTETSILFLEQYVQQNTKDYLGIEIITSNKTVRGQY